MTYQVQYPAVGFPGINFGFFPDATQRAILGTVVPADDNYWGGGEFIYGFNNSGVALPTGTLCVWNGLFQFSKCPNTANLGQNVCVAYSNFTTTGAFYGWFQRSGQLPVSATASVAAGSPVGITGAGQIGAPTAGKQIMGAISQFPPATTVVITNANTRNNSPILQVAKSDGWFPGIALSGTGIAGGATIVNIDPSGRFVTMSANATATGTASVTGTYTNFIVVQADRPFAEGQIT